MSAHGVTVWGPDHFIALDSVGGKLVKIGRLDRVVSPVWACDAGCFLKGLAVVGDIAIFGRSVVISTHLAAEHDYEWMPCAS